MNLGLNFFVVFVLPLDTRRSCYIIVTVGEIFSLINPTKIVENHLAMQQRTKCLDVNRIKQAPFAFDTQNRIKQKQEYKSMNVVASVVVITKLLALISYLIITLGIALFSLPNSTLITLLPDLQFVVKNRKTYYAKTIF